MELAIKKLHPNAILPTYGSACAAGADLYACLEEAVSILPGQTVKIPTGLAMEIPEGYVGLIKSKSGLNVKHGLTAEGVIDAHYTGSIRVKIYNHTSQSYRFKAGDKIAQLVIVPCLLPTLELVNSLEETDRGENGFGSTGR